MSALYAVFSLTLMLCLGFSNVLPPTLALLLWFVLFPLTDIAFAWGPRVWVLSITVSALITWGVGAYALP